MKSFFKIFGKGVLGVILLPFIIVAFALYLVYCFALYLFQAVKSVVIFFQGKDYTAKLPEEILAEERMSGKVYDPITKTFRDKDEIAREQVNNTTTTTNTDNSKKIIYQQNIIISDKDKDKIDTNKLMNDFIEQNETQELEMEEPAQIENPEVKELAFDEEESNNDDK